jgi:predicted nucleotidyltransferase
VGSRGAARQLLERVRRALEPVLGQRLRGVVLYGSAARGEDRPDSDYDIMVLVGPPFDADRDSLLDLRTLYPLRLELDRPLEAMAVSAESFERAVYSLYRNAGEEGIRV